jgi:hypothetical protein
MNSEEQKEARLLVAALVLPAYIAMRLNPIATVQMAVEITDALLAELEKTK